MIQDVANEVKYRDGIVKEYEEAYAEAQAYIAGTLWFGLVHYDDPHKAFKFIDMLRSG
jgi:hypothetical protein